MKPYCGLLRLRLEDCKTTCDMKRDDKGRFVKGETPDGAIPFSEGSAKEMQLRSAASRKENRTLRETLLYVLREKGVDGLTKQERIVRDAIEKNDGRKVSIKDLRDIAEILGESKLNITIDQDTDTRPEIEIE